MNVEIKEENGLRKLFVDGEVFDWGIDDNILKSAILTIKTDSGMKDYVLKDIERHFVESFSEKIGKKVTLDDIIQDIKNDNDKRK